MWGSRGRLGHPLLVAGIMVWASGAVASSAQTTRSDEDALVVSVLAVPMRAASGDRCHVQAVVEVAEAGLATQAGEETSGAVEIVLHAFAVSGDEATIDDPAATVVDAATETVTWSAEADRQGLKLVTSLSLPAGQYRLRALARDTASGRRGVTQIALTVADEPVMLLPPLIPELGDTWHLTRSERPDLLGKAPPSPFFVQDQMFVPAARPRIAIGDRRLPVVVMGYGLKNHEAAITSEVLDAEGQPVPGTQFVVSPAQSARDGVDRIMGVLYLPELPDGQYRLALGATDGTATAEQYGAFAVDSTRPPSQLLRIVAPEVPPPAVEAYRPQEAASAAPAVPVKKLVDGYRALLATLDPDNREARIRALADFEIAAVADEPEARIPRLRKSQLKVVRELAARDREALVPLLTLHHDTCLAHRRSRRPWLGRHGADMLVEVAAVYAPSARERGARVVAAQALASLGGHLQAVGQSQGLELFRAALEYQPGHAAALIGLAADPEKRGGPYDVAILHLDRLLESHPEHREGRLRLALNLIRLDAAHGEDLAAGQRRRALGVLEGLVAGSEADWIHALAAQELARLHATDGKIPQAIRVLKQASGRMPEEQKTRIQLAHLLDRAGRPVEAQAVLDDLRPDWTGMTPPRGRYNQWPNRALDADRAALAEGAAHRQPLLVRAARLDSTGGVL